MNSKDFCIETCSVSTYLVNTPKNGDQNRWILNFYHKDHLCSFPSRANLTAQGIYPTGEIEHFLLPAAVCQIPVQGLRRKPEATLSGPSQDPIAQNPGTHQRLVGSLQFLRGGVPFCPLRTQGLILPLASDRTFSLLLTLEIASTFWVILN